MGQKYLNYVNITNFLVAYLLINLLSRGYGRTTKDVASPFLMNFPPRYAALIDFLLPLYILTLNIKVSNRC